MKDGQYETFKGFIKDYEYSEWCYRIAGAACFIVKLSVPSLANIEHFINAISSYALTETSIVFSQVDVNDRIINLL